MTHPTPTETDPDGSALWELDPFEVSAVTEGVSRAVVVLDGRTTSPATACALARTLDAAADWAEGKR